MPKAARITNYGVFNTGDIHGDVINTINRTFAGAGEDRMAEMQKRLAALADEIQKNAEHVENPDDALRRVKQTAEELGTSRPDRGVVLAYLDRLLAMTGKVPSVVAAISSVSSLVKGFLG